MYFTKIIDIDVDWVLPVVRLNNWFTNAFGESFRYKGSIKVMNPANDGQIKLLF